MVLFELLVIFVFALSLAGARRSSTRCCRRVALAAATAWTLLGSAAFGAMVGALFVVYVRAIGRESTLVFLGLCALVAGVGASLHLEPLIAGITAGLIVRSVLREAGGVSAT